MNRASHPASKRAPRPVHKTPQAPRRGPATPGELALAWAHSARFYITAAKIDQLPFNELPEVAFVGRSNAGKSTAINTLAQQRQLAYASKKPGRTQHINLFRVGSMDAADMLWADLPGYGYAAVERAAKIRWQQVMANYLEIRRSLSGVVQMIDSRHGFTELDRQLLEFVAPRVRNGEVKLLVLLTKADKLNRKESTEALRQAQEVLGELSTEESDISVTLFSALKKVGVADVAEILKSWAAPPELAQALAAAHRQAAAERDAEGPYGDGGAADNGDGPDDEVSPAGA
ncbi:YihA family ribosome biogenesis GTP-binding protein [Aquabacterium soli]|jgi:GTP-binding protein|uniref:Probable GTP-binding protein EngB n=1 Tax=Aquabacterium soli TaxID=2493092 RepID=A0A426VDD8_9BURK|nr:YihA family ribosome biogenesis GTP-binding protein [Aquabacterium soli]